MRPPETPHHRRLKSSTDAAPHTPKHARVMGSRVVCATPHRGKGKALDNYSLGDRLGRGASATVYKAIHLKTGEFAAVKQMPLEKIKAVESIMGEIELLQNLEHPNIVKYLGFMKDEENLNIVLEYCENGSLAMICRKFGSFPENLLSVYMRQVLEGLVYLHDQGTIHRDIKGANILTTKEGVAKLADFGVATRALRIDEEAYKPGVVGTPHWMAPEVIQMQEPSPSCDIWSLGATVVELRTGQPPYGHLNDISAMYMVVQRDSNEIIPSESSGSLRDFLELCFEKDPRLRVKAKQLLNHHWIRKFGGGSSSGNDAKTIQKLNSPKRRKSLAVPSRLDLNGIFREQGAKNEEENYEDDFESLGLFGKAGLNQNFIQDPVSPKRKIPANSTPLPIADQTGANDDGGGERKPLQAFVDNDDDTDYADFDSAPALVPEQQASVGQDDPFEGLDDLMVDAPDELVMAAMEEAEKLMARVETLSSHQLELVFLRLGELIVAVPHIARLIHQHRVLQRSLFLLRSRALQGGTVPLAVRAAFLDLVLGVLERGELHAAVSFWLAGGLSFLLGQIDDADTAMKQRILALLHLFCSAKSEELARHLAYREDAISVVCSFFDPVSTGSDLLKASAVVLAIFRGCGPRNRADLWHHFNEYGLLSRIAELLHLKDVADVERVQENLFLLISSFAKCPSELLQKFTTRSILRRFMRAYNLLPVASPHRLTILHFFKETSTLPSVLDAMHRGGILPHLIAALKKLLHSSTPDAIAHGSVNCLLPTFYNYSRLSRSRQREVAEYKLLPLLHETVGRFMALREFAWPIFCALAQSGHPQCWLALWDRHSFGLDTLVLLLREKGWEAMAIAAIATWMDGNGQEHLIRERLRATGDMQYVVGALANTHGADSFDLILTAVVGLFDRHRALFADIDIPSLFGTLRDRLIDPHASSSTLVHMLQLITWITAARPDAAVPALESTELRMYIERLLNSSEHPVRLPVLAQRLATTLCQGLDPR